MEAGNLKLKSGHGMPVLGLGTWNLTGKRCEEIVRKALELGYRHIDTAEIYGNEGEIGRAIEGFGRSSLFITSKVWLTELGRDRLLRSCAASLKRLGTDYLDLYLVHWPNDKVPLSETMGAMAELVERGMVRSVGVSNFDVSRCKAAAGASTVPVSVNQVEFHPHLYQKDLLGFCREEGIVLTAYSPLARGDVLGDTVIGEIAGRHGKTPAQVSLRWLLQHGTVAIPKSGSETHLIENMGIFGWKLGPDDMKRIDEIGVFRRQVNPVFTGVPFFATASRVLRKLRQM
jgi:diketogulonate reductase-like aldo/keto reductase